MENAENYRKTRHFESMTDKDHSLVTPTCVTCHGSINTSIPKSEAIARNCVYYHNTVTNNSPEIPEVTKYLVERLSFINFYVRYLISKGVVELSPDFASVIDREFSELAQTWHTLELDRIKEKTLQIRILLIKKRKELRKTQ